MKKFATWQGHYCLITEHCNFCKLTCRTNSQCFCFIGNTNVVKVNGGQDVEIVKSVPFHLPAIQFAIESDFQH